MPFSLLFKTYLGPGATSPVYLRPETAQAHFLNFRRLLEYNQGVMPFASASVGRVYRNETDPGQGLLSARELTVAEMEHFVDPEETSHERLHEVDSVTISLLGREAQPAGDAGAVTMTAGEAVKRHVVSSETLGYFIARTHLFLGKVGLDAAGLRFRQHLSHEMAHYAADCWAAEIATRSHGWVECAQCVDRRAFDLTVHAQQTGAHFVVRERRALPLTVNRFEATLNKRLLQTRMPADVGVICQAVDRLNGESQQDMLEELARDLAQGGVVKLSMPGLSEGKAHVELGKTLISVAKVSRLESWREYTPNVVHISFQIGRIQLGLLDQCYRQRAQDLDRAVRSPFPLTGMVRIIEITDSRLPGFVSAHVHGAHESGDAPSVEPERHQTRREAPDSQVSPAGGLQQLGQPSTLVVRGEVCATG